MIWKDKLGQAHANIAANASNVADEVLAQYVPQIRQFLAETVGPVIAEAARDDEIMTVCIELVYEKIPPKVRWVVRKKAFIRFCLKHRDKLIPVDSPDPGVLTALPECGASTPPPLPVSATEGTSHGCEVSRLENLQ